MGPLHHVVDGSQSGVMEGSYEVNEVYDQRDEENECDESYSLYMISVHSKAPILVDVFDEYEHFLFKTYGFTKVDYNFTVTMDIPQITLNLGPLNVTIDFFPVGLNVT